MLALAVAGWPPQAARAPGGRLPCTRGSGDLFARAAAEHPRRARRTRPPAADPFMVAVTRICGIAAGVATMLLMSVLILPKSATIESLRT